MIVLVFVTLTDRAEAQVPEQYSAFTEPKAEAGGTRAQLSAPLPHLCPPPPAATGPQWCSDIPFPEPYGQGLLRLFKVLISADSDLSWGSTWPLNWKTKYWASVSSLCAPAFQLTVRCLLSDTSIVSCLCNGACERGRWGAHSVSPGVRGCTGLAASRGAVPQEPRAAA